MRIRLLPVIMLSMILTGCASVKISSVDTSQYVDQRRGDVITTGDLSQRTRTTLYSLDSSAEHCTGNIPSCVNLVNSSKSLTDEERLSALSEIELWQALDTEKRVLRATNTPDYEIDYAERQAIGHYFESARAAYAYLFFTPRTFRDRALEDRLSQVRDYYNLSVQNATAIIFREAKKQIETKKALLPELAARIEGWHVSADLSHVPDLSEPGTYIAEVVPDTTVTFDGIRNQYSRDGIGALMVATTRRPGEEKGQKDPNQFERVMEKLIPFRREEVEAKPWRRMAYQSVTILMQFPGTTLDEVMKTREAVLRPYDAYGSGTITVNGIETPLAANFSAGYGLWLANSDFARQSLGTLLGRGDVLSSPRVYLMEPYHPKKHTIILVHGLMSSPEAWVNAANEIAGDDELRNHFQIWQIYYPTSVPLLYNRREIATAIEKTFDFYDKGRKNPASRDVVLIGHSMGGILSRLLVSDANGEVLPALKKEGLLSESQFEKAEKSEKVRKFFEFRHLPEVTRAVFLAAPHRGTPFADMSIARWLASFVKLPVSVLGRIKDTAFSVLGKDLPANNSLTGVDNLSAKDPTIRALANLRISPTVTYHSIMGYSKAGVAVKDSSDGIVPYSSAHWDGAESELVVPSGHSVQETPKAILEIRRILHEHLEKLGEVSKP